MKLLLLTFRRFILLTISVSAMVVALESVLVPNTDELSIVSLLPGAINFLLGVLAWVLGCK